MVSKWPQNDINAGQNVAFRPQGWPHTGTWILRDFTVFIRIRKDSLILLIYSLSTEVTYIYTHLK